MEKEKLINILNDLKEVRTETKSKVSDEVLFQQGVDIYISEKINESYQKKQNSPATQSQKNLMTSLNIKFKDNITKKEAQELISAKIR